MTDYVEKIRNLLALAESSNEYEARDALLKARQLMAKHKISDREIKEHTEENVVQNKTGITYSKRRDPWMYDLARTIAEYHCCRNFQVREKGKQVAEIGFIGLSDDLPVCLEVFQYAVDCIYSVTKKLRKDKGVKTADSYGFGFTVGLRDAYHKQQTKEKWVLVLYVPKTVDAVFSNIKIHKTNNVMKLQDSDMLDFRKGIMDGHKFHAQKRIKHSSRERPLIRTS